MDFTALKAELVARGFDHLSSTRQGYLINQARNELDMLALWPYREDFASGASPLSITNLGMVEQVVDNNTECTLAPSTFSVLLEEFGDLSITGSSLYFYVATPSGVPTVATYPISDDIEVQYWNTPVDLSAGADEPASPDRLHLLIVDMAEARATMDVGRREALRVQIERDTNRALEDLLVQHQGAIATQRLTYDAQDW